MKKLLLALILLNFGDTLLAQTSLRNLILNSDYIIVIGDSGYAEQEPQYDAQINSFGFLDTNGCNFIKGRIAVNRIRVNRDFYYQYPYSYPYDEFPSRILFIKNLSGQYFLIDDWLVSQNMLTIFKQLYAELTVISEFKDEKLKFEKTVDWIISFVEKSDEDVYEHDLDSTSLFIKYYKQRGIIKSEDYLAEGQKIRLKNYIFSKNISYAKLRLLDLIYTDFKEEIDNKLIFYIKSLDPKKNDFVINLCMEKLLNENDPESIKELVDGYDTVDTKRKKKIIKTFLRSKGYK